MDYKPILLDQLGILEKAERQAKQPFKARAYTKVLREIQGLPAPIHKTNLEQVLALPGVGESLAVKIREIFETGALHQAKEAQQDSAYDIHNALLKIYGVGPVKALELVRDHGIRSLDDLRAHQDTLLNEKQRIGLKYYDDINSRIPRAEMKKHERVLLRAMAAVDARLKGEVVGSFRRGAADSGDVDFLLTLPGAPAKESAEVFQRFIQYLMGGVEYLTDILAAGPKKCMGVGRVGTKKAPGAARRIDILFTPENEYPYAVLYFTGSDRFNIAMRRGALELGYTMNEHGMTPVAKGAKPPPAAPPMATEQDIFEFLGYAFVPPPKRTDESALRKK